MKRFYFFLFCELMGVQVFAQNKWADIWCDTWNVLQHSTGINYEPNLGEETWIYYLAKDTIINNLTYTSVYRYWSIKDLSTSAYYAAVRFTEDKKVYVYYDNKEYLVYDFLAQVGDTLQVFGGYHYEVCNTMPCVVHEVKTDSITNRTLMKLYAINVHDGTICNGEFQAIEWIEGVGSIRGLLTEEHPCIVGGLRHQLLCAHHGDDLEYAHNSLYGKYGCEYNAETQNKWADIWCDTWNVMEYTTGMGEKTRETWCHRLAQDTVINGLTYTFVRCFWTHDETIGGRYATVRFTEDKKVYALIDGAEHLVYDFSVQVGDTIETIVGAYWKGMYQTLCVHEIKTNPETNRKTIILNLLCSIEDAPYTESCCPIEWIEGIGDTQGFLMGYPVCEGWSGGIGCNLLCAYKDNELQYTGSSYDTFGCEYNTAAAVEDIHTSKSPIQKIIHDGQLLIQSEGKTYNVLGVEVGNY